MGRASGIVAAGRLDKCIRLVYGVKAPHCIAVSVNDCTTPFDRRLVHVPHKWRSPIVEVVETFETVQLGLKSIGIDDSFVLTEAVRFVFDRKDKSAQELM